MNTTQTKILLEAELGKDVHVVEYREWRGIKGFISWEHILKADRFEGDTVLKVTTNDFPKVVIVNGEKYNLVPCGKV